MTDLILAVLLIAVGAVGATVYFLIKPNRFEKLHKEALEELDKLKGKLP